MRNFAVLVEGILEERAMDRRKMREKAQKEQARLQRIVDEHGLGNLFLIPLRQVLEPYFPLFEVAFQIGRDRDVLSAIEYFTKPFQFTDTEKVKFDKDGNPKFKEFSDRTWRRRSKALREGLAHLLRVSERVRRKRVPMHKALRSIRHYKPRGEAAREFRQIMAMFEQQLARVQKGLDEFLGIVDEHFENMRSGDRDLMRQGQVLSQQMSRFVELANSARELEQEYGRLMGNKWKRLEARALLRMMSALADELQLAVGKIKHGRGWGTNFVPIEGRKRIGKDMAAAVRAKRGGPIRPVRQKGYRKRVK